MTTNEKVVMATGQQQQFCVRWNSYQSNLQNAFPKLLTSEHFVDVTLACESEMIKCHKVVLSACSTYFEKLLVQNPCQHPIIFMKDMRFIEMQALVDFMYKGEVNVTQDELPSLLKSAEALQIRGLCGSDQLLSQHYLGALQSKTNANNAEKTQSNRGSVSPKHSENASGDELSGSEQTKPECTLSIKKETITQPETPNGHAPSSDELEPSLTIKEDYDADDSYYDNEGELIMDSEYMDQEEEDPTPGTSGLMQPEQGKTPEFAIANVSCQYSSDGSPGMAGNRRIRRSEAELRRAAECITRGQTFQTVSDQFNIPISTIR